MNTAAPATAYFFGDCELDVFRGCLRCAGKELSLRYQSFQLLLYFLEHPGTLITKDELTTAIWSDTSVTDNALVQCIAEIRRGLNDNPRNPRFIKTFPKIGYRFIETVEVAHVSPHPIALETLPSSRLTVPNEQLPAITPQRPPLPVGQPDSAPGGGTVSRLILFGFFAILLLFLYGDGTQSITSVNAAAFSFSGPPTLAVFPLDNGTGRQDIDWLREGLSDMILTNLTNRGEANVLSRERAHALFDESSFSHKLPLGKALEVARSVHATDFIMGTILASGQQVRISIETRDGKDGHLIASDSTSLSDSREIVVEANLLSTDIARHLGFATDATPSPADVATRDVEAYRYYSLGVEKAAQFQNMQAITLLKKAIEFDPRFAMAYARIGYAYAVTDFQPESGNRYLERAMQLSASLPTLNRLYIEAWTAIAHADYNTAIGILQQITNQYPNETEAYCQLSRLLRGEERVAEAGSLLKNAIQRNPDAKDLYNAYGLILISMENPLEAIDAYKHYVALAPQNPNAHDSLGMAYQQAGQYGAAITEFSEALKRDPEFEPSIVHLGDSYYQQGQYQDALREYRRYIQVASCSNAKALGYGDLAIVYLAMNKLAEAQTAAGQELRYNKNAVWNSLVFALDKHQMERTRVLQKILFANQPNPERGSPHDLRMEFFYRGYIELKTGNAQSALSYFRSALRHLPPSSSIDLHEDCLANAYLELGMLPDAMTEYQRILRLNPNYPLAYFHLGQTYQRLHDSQNAAIAFKHFLQANPSADQDSPPVLETKHDLEARSTVSGGTQL